MEVANLGELLALFKALRDVGINDLQLDILHRPDPVDCLVRHEPRPIVDDLYLVCDVFCCAKSCQLVARSG
jgi:hypothetical protein